MASPPGSRIGQYEIVALLGAGGMGEVYRARDTRLQREVALKLLPDTFASDPDRVARFEREAHTLAALNDPHIAQVYGFERGESSQALVMELVEGEDLSQLISRGALSLDDALPIARQIADALEAAHDAGIIHRDLKPANIKVRPNGTVKVLDFGLAKALGPTATSPDHPASLTITSPVQMTHAGMILGTAAYMSPEQVKGRPADKRSDLWSFGCVLFEMLTATRPFRGDDVADTLAAVLRAEPEWSLLPPLPPTITDLLRRSLIKDPRARLSDVSVIKYLLDQPAAAVAQPPRAHSRWSYMIAAAGVAAALLVGGWAGWSFKANPLVEPARFVLPMVGANSFSFGGPAPDLAMSPDGKTMVYVTGNGANDSLAMGRTLDQAEFTPIAGAQPASSPFFSPDGRWLGFASPGFLKKTLMAGGMLTPTVVSRVAGAPVGATWTTDGSIIFATNDQATGLLEVSEQGGELRVLTTPSRRGEFDHLSPSVLPDNQAVVFTIKTSPSRDDSSIGLYDRKTGEYSILLKGGSHPRYVAPGFLIFGTGNAINAVHFDLRTRQISGAPVAVVDSVAVKATGVVDFALSDNGTLLYRPPNSGSSSGLRKLAWVDRAGRETVLDAPPRLYAYARLAPDDRSIALDARDQQQDIWLWSASRLTRVTVTPELEAGPIWTPDGKALIFASQASGGIANLYLQPVNASGNPQLLAAAKSAQIPSSISPDGKTLIFTEINIGTTASDIMAMEMSTRTTSPVLQTTFNESNGSLSPDGRYLAYQSDQSGEMQVYVRSLIGEPIQVWPVSSGGGSRPVWARNGELFYVDGRGALIAVKTTVTPTFTADTPVKALNAGSFFPGSGAVAGRTYDVSADGQRFLVLRDADPSQVSATPQMIVILNWVELVRRQLAAAER